MQVNLNANTSFNGVKGYKYAKLPNLGNYMPDPNKDCINFSNVARKSDNVINGLKSIATIAIEAIKKSIDKITK